MLARTDLSGAMGLTWEAVRQAHLSRTTRLPADIVMPTPVRTALDAPLPDEMLCPAEIEPQVASNGTPEPT